MGTTREHSPVRIKRRRLYLGTSIASLEELVKKDETLKNIKNVNKLPPVLNKLKTEIYKQIEDQEKCFLLCSRYIYTVELLYKLHEDPKYIHSLFCFDLDKIKNLLLKITFDLRERYHAEYESDYSGSSRSQATEYFDSLPVTDSEERIYIQPTTSEPAPPIIAPAPEVLEPVPATDTGRKIFKEWFIKPLALYDAIIRDIELLIVDIRLSAEFTQCHIIIKKGNVINIPSKLIVPGDSANTLGKKLDADTQLIWQRRETFEAIVLLDNSTMKYDYQGSKLALLRSLLVEWDINKKYTQEPVVLNGGIKEFIEWYPSQVTNRHAYLVQNCNVEIDELLDIDSIVYPEPGSSYGPRNVKMFSLHSIGNLYQRIARDFGLSGEEGDEDILTSRSEGQLPFDAYESQEVIPGPFESISETLMTPEMSFTEAVPDKTADLPEVTAKKPRLIEPKEHEIKGVIQENRDTLLKEARAVKPKSEKEVPPIDISHKVEGVEIEVSGVDVTTSKETKEKPSTGIARPAVVRSPKPDLSRSRSFEWSGEGFTGLKNIKNICYMNTILQSVKVIPLIKKVYVTSNLYKYYTTLKPPVINYDFAAVMQDLWRGYYNPDSKRKRQIYIKDLKAKIVLLNPVYERGHHEDTFEFFSFLFSQISQDSEYEINKPAVMTDSQRAWVGNLGGVSSFYIDLFFYQTKSRRVCRKCNKINISYEMDSSLMLPLPDRACTLEGLIVDYMQATVIQDFACTKCKTIGSLIHYKEVVAPPDILVIVLKRYRVGRDGRISKNIVPVSFPTDNLKFGNGTYKLYSIPQHVGTMDSGHYYTTVLLKEAENVWYTFNDEKFTKASDVMSDNDDIEPNCVGFFFARTDNCDNNSRV